MALTPCPLCGAKNPAESPRCASCGADPRDPDVLAAAGAAADAPVAPEATLAGGRVLGFTRDESSLRRLAGWGGALLAVAFFIPAMRTHRAYRMSWDLFREGPRVALLLPLLLGVVGVAVALVPRVPTWLRAALLGVAGAAGIAFCLGPLGYHAGAPRTLVTVEMLGFVVTGAALAARLFAPTARDPRLALIAGAALVIVGLLIPVADVTRRLPVEYAAYANMLGLRVRETFPLRTLLGGLDRRAAPIFFLSFLSLLPVIAAPAAALLAWRRAKGPWDRSSLGLVPLAWLLVLFVPWCYALATFNAMGWGGTFAESVMLARLRLTGISLVLFLWLELALAWALSRGSRSSPA